MPCALCHKDKTLRKSHIYPEFLYDKIYDEDHTFKIISNSKEKRIGSRPKGIYEKLLCDDCETLLSKWETYASQVLFGGVELEVRDKNGQFIISGIEYAKFKLFQMSLLWRTAVSTRKEIPNITLGPHQERMRKMLLSEEPGPPYKYGCMMFFVPDHTEMLSGGIFPPEQFKLKAHHCFRCIFGGLFWVYFTSSHTHEVPYKDLMLSKDGKLPVTNAGQMGIDYLVEMAKDFRSSNEEFFDNLDNN